MPPRHAFTAEEARSFGACSAERATRASCEERVNASYLFTCAFRGTSTTDGAVDATAEITPRSTLVYDWRVTSTGIDETHEKKIRANDAQRRGVPFPSAWTAALKCTDFSSLILPAVESAQHASEATDIECTCVGVARVATLADSGATQPGATTVLSGGGARIAYILCACVRDGVWLCHRGTLDNDGAVDMGDPFSEERLVPTSVPS